LAEFQHETIFSQFRQAVTNDDYLRCRRGGRGDFPVRNPNDLSLYQELATRRDEDVVDAAVDAIADFGNPSGLHSCVFLQDIQTNESALPPRRRSLGPTAIETCSEWTNSPSFKTRTTWIAPDVAVDSDDPSIRNYACKAIAAFENRRPSRSCADLLATKTKRCPRRQPKPFFISRMRNASLVQFALHQRVQEEVKCGKKTQTEDGALRRRKQIEKVKRRAIDAIARFRSIATLEEVVGLARDSSQQSLCMAAVRSLEALDNDTWLTLQKKSLCMAAFVRLRPRMLRIYRPSYGGSFTIRNVPGSEVDGDQSVVRTRIR